MVETGKRSRSHKDQYRDGSRYPMKRRKRDQDGDKRYQKRWATNKEDKGGDGELIVYRILCPDDAIGGVIGKSGKVINSIRQDTRSKIKVVDPFPGANERVLTIYCYVKDKDDVDEYMGGPLCPAQDALLRVHSAIAKSLANVGDSDKKRKDKEQAHILVPASQAANIVGKSGATIKKLKNKTGANIKVSPKDITDPTNSCALEFDNFVMITGDTEAVKKALFAVSAIMYKFPPKEEVPLETTIPEASPSMIIPSDTGSTWPAYSSGLPVVSSYAAPSRSEELKIRLICPLEKIGRVIGKGGSSIKSVRQETGANVEIVDTKGNRDECLIMVTSTESPDDLKSKAVEAVLMLQGKINDNDDNDRVSIRLLVPSKVIGCIIGKSGSIINEMRKRTKADVRISKCEKPKCADNRDEIVEVVGGIGSVRDALVQIVLRLRDGALKDREGSRNPPADSMYPGIIMGSQTNVLPVRDGPCYVKLFKDKKLICCTQCIKAPTQFPAHWEIKKELKPKSMYPLKGLPHFYLHPAFKDDHQRVEWGNFINFLRKYDRVAEVPLSICECYILPPIPGKGTDPGDAVVLYKMRGTPDGFKNDRCGADDSLMVRNELVSNVISARNTSSYVEMDTPSDHHGCETIQGAHCRSQPITSLKQDDGLKKNFENDGLKKNFVRTDPLYLKTLGQTHSGWIFGAIAELVDNSRDAKATKLEISIEMHYSKKEGIKIPMLSVVDDGCGMSHEELLRMLSFGHKGPDTGDRDPIGRYGIGFKTGAMKLGRDVIILTQTMESRSIGFLSQSFNEDKDNLEIPIVSYSRNGSIMEVDRSIQSESSADYHIKAIKEFSPFNEFFIGEKLALFGENGKGTQIYIWNLEKWGLDFCLEWQKSNGGKSSSNEDDILIRSRRIRSRSGQISREVPLDYSLRSYLEVIFLDPRMKIYVQGSLVKSRPLAKSLNTTKIYNGEPVIGKPVQLALGRSQQEWERMNCGIFLYWHGRLIEAYKRVGGMVHNLDVGRGVIGVMDVTDVMSDGNDALVHNTKQAFLDSETYAKLEKWLGERSDEYWDDNFDTLPLKNCNARYKPDHEWVQCDKCRKWRILSSDFDSTDLPEQWFCFMPPYNGTCGTPEEVEHEVITLGTKWSRCDLSKEKPAAVDLEKVHSKPLIKSGSGAADISDESSQTTFDENNIRLSELKRLQLGFAKKVTRYGRT